MPKLAEHHTWDFAPGDEVKIVAGKYGGCVGTVVEVNTGDNLDMIGVSFGEGDEEYPTPGPGVWDFTPDSLENLSSPIEESLTESNHRRCDGCNKFLPIQEYADGITNRCSNCQSRVLSKMESTRSSLRNEYAPKGMGVNAMTIRDLIEQVARGANVQSSVRSYLSRVTEEEVIPSKPTEDEIPTTGVKATADSGEAASTPYTKPDPTVASDDPDEAEKKLKSAPTDGADQPFAERFSKQARSVLNRFLKEEGDEEDMEVDAELEEEDDEEGEEKKEFPPKKEEARRFKTRRMKEEEDDEEEDPNDVEESDDEDEDDKPEFLKKEEARRRRMKELARRRMKEEEEEDDEEEIEEEDDEEEPKEDPKKEEARRRRMRVEKLRRRMKEEEEEDEPKKELVDEEDEEGEEEEEPKKEARRSKRPFVREKVDSQDTVDPQIQIGEDVSYVGSDNSVPSGSTGKVIQSFPHADGYIYSVEFAGVGSRTVPHEDLKRLGGLFGEGKKRRPLAQG